MLLKNRVNFPTDRSEAVLLLKMTRTTVAQKQSELYY